MPPTKTWCRTTLLAVGFAILIPSLLFFKYTPPTISDAIVGWNPPPVHSYAALAINQLSQKVRERLNPTEPLPPPPAIEHPIPGLIEQAEINFNKRVARQSKNFTDVIKEYYIRYSRLPPKNFDEWYKFAMERDVKIVDEYDGMIDDLRPFWGLSGAEIRRRAEQAAYLPSIAVVRVEGGVATLMRIPGQTYTESQTRAYGLIYQIRQFVHKLPDMSFPVNGKAEGRVLVSWERLNFPGAYENDSSKGLDAMFEGRVSEAWQGAGSVWSEYRRTCSPNSKARRLYSSVNNEVQSQRPLVLAGAFSGPSPTLSLNMSTITPGAEFHFANETDEQFDYCTNPSAHIMQGHFFSDFRTFPALYPIFSYGKGRGYADIRFPSHYYMRPTKGYSYGYDPVRDKVDDRDSMEVDWENKTNVIFWRGAIRGGSTPWGFAPFYHRHRFVRMANDQTDTQRHIVYQNPVTGTYSQLPVEARAINDEIMDVAFTHSGRKYDLLASGYPGGMNALFAEHRFVDSEVPLGENWKHKYLMDIDGVGYSARFLAYLESDSAVMKSTVYQEFFEGWIEPWLHYIPVSQSYSELYNIHSFFNGPTHSVRYALNNDPQESAHMDLLRTNLPAISNLDLSLPPSKLKSQLKALNINLPVSELKALKESRQKLGEGDRLLRKIAQEGKKWKRSIGRGDDAYAYVYRLCLEWARLWSDDREGMTLDLKALGIEIDFKELDKIRNERAGGWEGDDLASTGVGSVVDE